MSAQEQAKGGEHRTILKAVVGSQAHGLAGPDSDTDYRGVFVVPTTDILCLGGSARRTSWLERDDAGQVLADDVAWEVGHFLGLATKCNPSILECMAAPAFEADEWGRELRALLPSVWNPKGVRGAFVGYGLNQRKKMLDDKDKRPWKFACAYLRTLAAAECLLATGTVLMDTRGHTLHADLVRFKAGEASKGEIIDLCDQWTVYVEDAFAACRHEPNVAAANDYLLRLRRANW